MKNISFISILLISLTIKGQETKDTLYFKFNRDYLQIYEVTPGQYYLVDSSDDGVFFFEKMETLTDLKPKKILCLKKYVRNSEYYDKSRKRKLYDYELYDHLKNYIIFLVKRKEYIKVRASFEIE